MFEKVSRSLKYDSNIFFVHKHNIYIYGHHNQSLYPARAARAGNNRCQQKINVGRMKFVIVDFLNCVPTSKEIQHPRYTVAEHILSQQNRIEFTITREQSTFL